MPAGYPRRDHSAPAHRIGARVSSESLPPPRPSVGGSRGAAQRARLRARRWRLCWGAPPAGWRGAWASAAARACPAWSRNTPIPQLIRQLGGAAQPRQRRRHRHQWQDDHQRPGRLYVCAPPGCASGATAKARIWRAASRPRCCGALAPSARLRDGGDASLCLEVDEAAFARSRGRSAPARRRW